MDLTRDPGAFVEHLGPLVFDLGALVRERQLGFLPDPFDL